MGKGRRGREKKRGDWRKIYSPVKTIKKRKADVSSILASVVPEVTIQADAGELSLRAWSLMVLVYYTVSTLNKLCLGMQ